MRCCTPQRNSDDWRLWLTAAGLPSDISRQPGITFDLIFMTVQAAIDGIGVAMGRTSYVAGRHRQGPARGSLQDRAAGRRRLLSGLAGGRAEPPKLAAFRQWLIASAQNKA